MWYRRYLSPICVLMIALAACNLSPGRPAQEQVTAALVPLVTPAPPASPTTMSMALAAGAVTPSLPAACPMTHPPEPSFAPSPPYPPAAPPLYAGQFWYGTERLWTMLRTDGTWRNLPYYAGKYVQKTFWWQQDYSWRADPEPKLTVTGRRLDAPAPPLTASRATNGYRDDIASFMLVGIDLPTPGCWEITGRIGDAALTFVVWVAP